MCWPLAASLLLTHCGCDLMVIFRAAPCSVSTKKISATAACKLARCVVSASEAASGLLTRPDDGCSHKSAWYPVQCAAAAPTPYAGGGFQRRGDRPPPLVASFFLYSFFAGEERIEPPEGASPAAWNILRRKNQQPHRAQARLHSHHRGRVAFAAVCRAARTKGCSGFASPCRTLL